MTDYTVGHNDLGSFLLQHAALDLARHTVPNHLSTRWVEEIIYVQSYRTIDIPLWDFQLVYQLHQAGSRLPVTSLSFGFFDYILPVECLQRYLDQLIFLESDGVGQLIVQPHVDLVLAGLLPAN